MLLDKPYWISKNDEQEYFETMSLLHLKNIINLIRRTYKSPELHPTYNYAVKIYEYRLKLIALPHYVDDKQVGYIKNNKIYIKQEYNPANYKHDDVIRCDLEERYLKDTRIPIGTIDFKGVIKENDL